MGKRQKLLDKIRNNPKTVPFQDLDKILRWYNFTPRSRSSGSSHHVYVCGAHSITVPYKRPYVKTYYVKEVLRILDEMEAPAEEDDE